MRHFQQFLTHCDICHNHLLELPSLMSPFSCSWIPLDKGCSLSNAVRTTFCKVFRRRRCNSSSSLLSRKKKKMSRGSKVLLLERSMSLHPPFALCSLLWWFGCKEEESRTKGTFKDVTSISNQLRLHHTMEENLKKITLFKKSFLVQFDTVDHI